MKYVAILLFVGLATALPVSESDSEAQQRPQQRRPDPGGPGPVKRQSGYAPAPPPIYKPAPAYRPAPAAYKPEVKLPPQPYQFEYGVADQYTGTNFQAVENQDAQGTVIGSYRVNLPDGRIQTVTYTADHVGGFVADVSYEGVAQYPPEKEYVPYKKPAPKYAPAPPKYAPA